MPDVVVKKSRISGIGVFAARDFKEGDIVLKWDTGYILTKAEFEKMSREDKRYITFFNKKYVFMQPPERYVNHSCNPNTTGKDFCDVANKDIIKGEEITSNYSDYADEDLNFECHCKGKSCKGFVKYQAPKDNI